MNSTRSTRVLGATDTVTLRSMLKLFGEAFEDQQRYCNEQPDDGYLKRLLSSEQFIAIAALDGPVVVGGLAGYVLAKFEQARSEFYSMTSQSLKATAGKVSPQQ